MRPILFCTLALFACTPDGAGTSTSTTSGTTTPGPGSTSSGTTGGTPGGTTTTQTFPIPQGWQRVDLNGGAAEASVDATIGDDGTLYVSWVDNDDIFVSYSLDEGNTWEPPVQVDGASIIPFVGSGRQPYVHAGPDTLWVTFTTLDPTFTVRLYSSDLGTLSFTEQPIALGNAEFVDYAKVATDANGDAWVTWISYLGDQIWPSMARQANGFATEDAGSLVGFQPCECCRNDLFFTSSGTGILTFRNNDVPYRDIWSMRAPSGQADFTANVQVSTTGWQSYACPMQGPRIAELGNGDLITTWTDPTTGPWQIWTTKSTDDGLSWAGDAQAMPSLPGEQRTPAIAATETSVWLTVEDANGYTLLESTDSGDSFSERERLDSGATNIVEPQVEARDGMALVVGANAAGEVVLQRLQ